MSRKTDCSSVVRFPVVFCSRIDRRSMISLACGKLTGREDCCGSSCSPMSIRDELPSEITNDAKVTGMPEPWDGSDDAVREGSGEGGAAGDDVFSAAPPPRRSRMT